MVNPLVLGFFWILIAALAGGAFGLQYRIMRQYQVENASFLSVFVATVPIPLIACSILLPGWTEAISKAGFASNATIFFFGFCWGMGAITYAYGFNLLGMALAASLLKGISIAIGAGVPLVRHWEQVSVPAKATTIAGLAILMVGTAVAGKAGIMREKEAKKDSDTPLLHPKTNPKPSGRLFWIGFILCLISGFASSGANLGYDRADVIEKCHGRNFPWRRLDLEGDSSSVDAHVLGGNHRAADFYGRSDARTRNLEMLFCQRFTTRLPRLFFHGRRSFYGTDPVWNWRVLSGKAWDNDWMGGQHWYGIDRREWSWILDG